MRRPAFLPSVLVLLCACRAPQPPADADGAPEPFIFGEVHHVHSSILREDRILNILLPEGYADSTLAYPVVYVLDGSANEDFPHIAGIVRYLNMYGLFPKSIVVGIANVDRARDFTAPTQGDSDRVWVPTGGGSAAFMDFLERELQPYVEQHFRTAAPRTVIGQSLGGLLVMEVLFTRPGLFDDYVAVSPSLWWNNGALAQEAGSWVQGDAAANKRLYIAMAADDDWSRPEVDTVVAALHRCKAAPFAWWYEPFPQETHATILHRAAYRALEVLGKQPG